MASTHPGAPAGLRALCTWRGDTAAHYRAGKLLDLSYRAFDETDSAAAADLARTCGLRCVKVGDGWTAWETAPGYVVLTIHGPKVPNLVRDIELDLQEGTA